MKIGIPVLNRGDLLAKLVHSIDLEAEVLVIVNRIGPIDPSVEDAVGQLEQHPPGNIRLQVRRIEGNLGVSGSWNSIIEHFGGNCWISNSDISFTPGVLAEAMAQVEARRTIVLQHLWAAACFYVTDRFASTLGWFDENFYPAYHEDQEMALRGTNLQVQRCCFPKLGPEKVLHEGSQTIRNSSDAQRKFLRQSQHIGGEYLTRRWGQLPPRGSQPEKNHPFDDPSIHAADWTLDFEMRAQIAKKCEELTGFACPIVYHRKEGGLSVCAAEPCPAPAR